ncbi:hypothetical protein SH661x_001970 [Planctomicrobium sp. SH661]|uniref:hypothetical protein n=1 Tax=Planctomicrobium sp. SH661 TaxID=3448124 RepID=UPI003F5BD2E6
MGQSVTDKIDVIHDLGFAMEIHEITTTKDDTDVAGRTTTVVTEVKYQTAMGQPAKKLPDGTFLVIGPRGETPILHRLEHRFW